MKKKYISTKVILTCLITNSLYHTATARSLKALKFWGKAKTETVSIKKEVPENAQLILYNIDGNVNIRVWKQQKIVVQATKKGNGESLKKVTIKDSIQGKKFKLETIHNEKNINCSVEYDILIPENMWLASINTKKGNIKIEDTKKGVFAYSQKGSIILDHVEGVVKAKSDKGAITINTHTFADATTIQAYTKNGTINLMVPKLANADICLKAPKGKVTSDVPITLNRRTTTLTNKTYANFKKETQGSLGKGGESEIKLHTERGNIKVVYS